MKEEGVEIERNLVTGFIAGFQAGLKSCGLDTDRSIEISLELTAIIIELSGLGCGNCDGCAKRKKEAEKK